MTVIRRGFSSSLLRLFLLRLGKGGNTRWMGADLRLARDIPADGEFSTVPVFTGL
jgi:hypothetical protein